MATLITNGIKISVNPYYLPEESIPNQGKHIFTYRVTIENTSDQTVQLLRRHWHILDSSGEERQVEGEGVIGEQPILKPGESHQYNSWCPLKTSIGKMYGTYLMSSKTENNRLFYVRIPEFLMVATYQMN